MDGTQTNKTKFYRRYHIRWTPQRREKDPQALEACGQAIRVFELQGDLMFGTTESVVKTVLDTLSEGDYFILDLKHVFEIDRETRELQHLD